MSKHHIPIRHPLWERLCKLDAIAEQRFPSEPHQGRGFEALGLVLDRRLENGEYWCTPSNTLAFAWTGGNGFHFSFMIRDGMVNEGSPIVLTIPAGLTGNHIVGESLFDFLCLGFHRGYFGLEQWPSDPCIEAYQSAEWHPTSDRDLAVGLAVDRHQRQLLGFLTTELGLQPWGNVRHRSTILQERYQSLLVLPAE